jgi:hypothetical protein
MVSKDGANQAADALLLGEMHRRETAAARVVGALTWRYPVLKDVPASARRRLFRAARLQAARQRGVLLLAFISLGALLRVVYLTAIRGEPDSMTRWAPPLVGFAVMAVWAHVEIRRKLSDLVKAYGDEAGRPVLPNYAFERSRDE